MTLGCNKDFFNEKKTEQVSSLRLNYNMNTNCWTFFIVVNFQHDRFNDDY